MEEIIIPVVIVSIIQIVLIVLFVQATMNIKRIYELLYNKFENDRQEKIEAKQKEAQTGQGNQNSEPQSLSELKEQFNARTQSIDDTGMSTAKGWTTLLGVIILLVLIIFIIGVIVALS